MTKKGQTYQYYHIWKINPKEKIADFGPSFIEAILFKTESSNSNML